MVDENIHQDLNLIKEIIGLGFNEIVSYLTKHDKIFLISDALEKKIQSLNPNISNEVNQSLHTGKPIGKSTKIKNKSSALERSTLRSRGGRNKDFCNYSKVINNEHLKYHHQEWLTRIIEYNEDIKESYNKNQKNAIFQSFRLTIEKTYQEILRKRFLSDQSKKFLEAFKSLESKRKKKGYQYPNIFINDNSISGINYIDFGNGQCLDKAEFEQKLKTDLPFWVELILESTSPNFFKNQNKKFIENLKFIQNINKQRNSTKEHGHDLKNFNAIDNIKNVEEKIKITLEWFINDIAFFHLLDTNK